MLKNDPGSHFSTGSLFNVTIPSSSVAPDPVRFGTRIFQMVRPFDPELVVFSDFEFRTSLGTSVLFLKSKVIERRH